MQNRKRDTDAQNRLLDSVGEGEGGMFKENSIETRVLSRVKQITCPGWMHETSALTWCTGKTQRDRVEREVGGGIGMGNTCICKLFFNWRIIALQCCDGLCHISVPICHNFIHTHTHTHTHIYIYMHTHIYVHTHIYIHTYKQPNTS